MALLRRVVVVLRLLTKRARWGSSRKCRLAIGRAFVFNKKIRKKVRFLHLLKPRGERWTLPRRHAPADLAGLAHEQRGGRWFKFNRTSL